MLNETDQPIRMTNEQKQKWADEYGSKLESLEKKSAKSFQRFLKDEYFKGIDSFLNTSSDREFVSLFKLSELKELYIDLYKNIGTEFAVWYEKSFDKLLKKGNGDRNTWSRTFEQYGNTEAGKKISIVQGTALKEIRSTIGRLFKDEEFQKLGRQQQGRILKERFSGISQYQAERIVRTEATAAANQGIMQSATDIFPKGSLMKEWISSSDSRTRRFSKGDKADHAQMASHPPIPYDELFQVPTRAGAQRMFRPADSSHGASAYNVINCRCSIAVYPMEGADVREGVELTGFGGGVAARTTQLVANQIVTSRKPAREAAQDIIQEYQINSTRAANKALKDLGIPYTKGFSGMDPKVAEAYLNTYVRIKNQHPNFVLRRLGSVNEYFTGTNELMERHVLKQLKGKYEFSEIKRIIAFLKKTQTKAMKETVEGANAFYSTRNVLKRSITYGGKPIHFKIDVREMKGIYHNTIKDTPERIRFRMSEMIKKNWHAPVDESNYIYYSQYHEFAHALDFGSGFADSDVYKAIIKDFDNTPRSKAKYKDLVSNYAVYNEDYEINIREIIAESYAEYKLSSNPRPKAVEIGKALDKWIAENGMVTKNKIIEETESQEEDEFEGGVDLPPDKLY